MALTLSWRALLAAAVALLVPPAGAAGERRVAEGHVGGVAFAGEDVVYQDFAHDPLHAYAVGGTTRLVLLADRRRRVLLQLREGVDADDEPSGASVEWDASAAGLLYRLSTTVFFAAGPEDFSEVRGGPLRGPYRRLAKCEFVNDFSWYGVAVAGDQGAYRDDCASGEVTPVRSLSDPGSPPGRVVPGGGNVDMAGPYLALEQNPQADVSAVAVVDTRTGAELYRVTGLQEPSGGPLFAVQDDGKLAALTGGADGRTCTLAWFSPAEPRPHPVGDALCETQVRMAEDRIAVRRARGGRHELVVHDLRGREDVLASAPRREVNYDPGGGTTLGRVLAFDGRRAAYALVRCDGRDSLLVRASVAGPVLRDRDPVACPLTVLARSLRARSRDPELRLPVRCPRGCSGSAAVGDSSIGQPFFVQGGRRVAQIPLHVDDTTRDRLRRARRAEVTVKLSVVDRLDRASERRLRLTVFR